MHALQLGCVMDDPFTHDFLRNVVIKYGLIFHPTVDVRYQLCAYAPDEVKKAPPQVSVVNPHDVKDEPGRIRALVRAVREGCTLDRPIVFLDENWLHQWGPQAAQVGAR